MDWTNIVFLKWIDSRIILQKMILYVKIIHNLSNIAIGTTKNRCLERESNSHFRVSRPPFCPLSILVPRAYPVAPREALVKSITGSPKSWRRQKSACVNFASQKLLDRIEIFAQRNGGECKHQHFWESAGICPKKNRERGNSIERASIRSYKEYYCIFSTSATDQRYYAILLI